MSAKNKNKKTFVIILSLMLTIVLVLAILLISKLNLWKNTNSKPIENNTNINGINISGLSKSEAIEAVNSYIKNKAKDFTLTLKYKDEAYTLDSSDYTINKDIHTIVDVANNSSEYKDTLKELKYFTDNGNSTMVAFNYIFQGLDDKIDDVISKIETQPLDSNITFNPNSDKMFEITEDKIGYVINKQKLYEEINKQFLNHNNVLVELELEPKEASITKEYNESLTDNISTFSTSVSDSTGGRKNNVKLALSKFNGMIVQPKESISFNEITSPHTLDNGYQIATIISEGKFVDGVGGGVCQASTTLYNALILAGMQIDEVHKHTLPVRYVPLALDAMVSGNSDMRFTNNTDYPIFIKTSSTSEDVTVSIFSKKTDVTYKTRSETLKEIPALPDKIVPDTKQEYVDKVLFKGETYRLTWGRGGYDTKSYLQTWQDGKMINEKLLRHEIYQPQPGIIIEGIAEPIEELPIIENEDNNQPLDIDNNFLFNTTPTNLSP